MHDLLNPTVHKGVTVSSLCASVDRFGVRGDGSAELPAQTCLCTLQWV